MPKAPTQCKHVLYINIHFVPLPLLSGFESLLDSLGRPLARQLLGRSFQRFVGNDDIVELVLRDGVDGVGVYKE